MILGLYRIEYEMSKLGCVCGHVIVDQTDQIPYKASFITDVDLFI